MEFIGGVVLSVLVERVVDFALNVSRTLFNIGNEHQATAEEVAKWHKMFGDLNGVLQDAEQKQSGNPGISLWLTDLADLAYEIEDILEKIEYDYKRAQQQENRSGWNLVPVLKRKRSEVPDKLEEITVKLNGMYKRKKLLHLFMGNPTVPKNRQIRPPDGSESFELIIYGREKEKNEIVELLVEPNKGSERVGIIPIVGMGGIGKTTLAQHVLNDYRVVDCFEITVWVCVSMEFERCRIYKRIVEAVTSRACDVQDECSIEDQVRSLLRNKKFLIILDDLWNEDVHEMSQLLGPFQFGDLNSKIVITTRNLEIAKQMKTVEKSIELIGISNEDCFSIFCSHARLDTESPLVAIGKELSKRCAGNPLAAAVMGGLLRGNENKESWMSVLNDTSRISKKGQCKIMLVLKMSYDNMPDCLKPCFLCCTMFPEDYEFRKEFLVQIWISSGLISTGDKDKQSSGEVESLACSYFDELVARSLLSKCSNYYVMHDLIRDMGTKISGNTFCRWENRVGSLEKTRHLTVHGSLIAQINYCLKEDTIRSLPLRIFLPINGRMERVNDMDNFILRARKLRVLSFEEMGISKIPEYIDQMIHLRYLDMSFCESLKEVPSEIGSLINLMYLNIRYCGSLVTLPTEIGDLINLTHLDIRGCINLPSLPSEIGRLINLTHLDIKYCGSLTTLPSEIGCLINLIDLNIGQCYSLTTLPSEIGSLNNLIHLNCSRCGKLTTLPSEIGNLINLTHLDIHGCINLTILPSEIGSLINLTHLDIHGCINLTIPSEIDSLINLTHLDVKGCVSLPTSPLAIDNLINPTILNFAGCESHATQLSEISSLMDLTTLNMNGCEWLPNEIGHLNNLKELIIDDCWNLKTISPEIGRLKNLKTLKISGCRKLMVLPSEIGSLINLRNLNIINCVSLTTLPSEIGSLISLRDLYICGCDGLITLPLEIGSLFNLTFLNIIKCHHLETLPFEIGSLINLKYLKISYCTSLTILSLDIGSLINLEVCKIIGCGTLILLPSEIGSLINLTHLNLKYCTSLITLPSEISSLMNLTQLDLQYCESLTTLPSEIGSLINLTILNICGCRNLKTLPWGISSLINLKTCKIFGHENLTILPSV